MQKQNSQRRPNNNNLVIKCGQGALVPSQRLQSSLVGLGVKKKKLPSLQGMWIPSQDQEDPLEEEMAAKSSISCLGNPMHRGAGWATTMRSQRIVHN